MSDAKQPVEYVMFGIDEDGNFILAVQADTEMKARAICHKGEDELNAYFRNELAKTMLASAQQRRIVPPNGRFK